MRSALPFRRAAGALVLGLAGALAACGDDDDGAPGADVEIQSVRFTVTPAGGTPTFYTVTANSLSDAPIPLRVGTSTITATPLDDNNQVVDEASEFELRLTGAQGGALPAGVTVSNRTGLTNTISATAAVATPTRVEAEMYHVAEGHGDYTAIFRITVAP